MRQSHWPRVFHLEVGLQIHAVLWPRASLRVRLGPKIRAADPRTLSLQYHYAFRGHNKVRDCSGVAIYFHTLLGWRAIDFILSAALNQFSPCGGYEGMAEAFLHHSANQVADGVIPKLDTPKRIHGVVRLHIRAALPLTLHDEESRGSQCRYRCRKHQHRESECK